MRFARARKILPLVLVVLGAATAAAASHHRPGSLDHSFSGNGRALVDFRPSGCAKHKVCDDYANNMAIDSRGRIIVGGFATNNRRADRRDAEIARLKPNGKLDRSFAGDGTKRFRGAGVGSIAIDSRDRIVLSPSVYGDGGGVIRLDTDGKFDQSFSGDGRASSRGDAVTVKANDSVIAADDFYDPDTGVSGLRVRRFAPDGDVDPTFDSRVIPFQSFPIEDAAIDSEGRIVIENYEYLVRLLPDGGPDPEFGGDGIVVRPDSRPEGYGCSCSRVAIDSRDRIVTGGRNVVHRYLPDGSLDRSFSGDGRIRTGRGKPHRRGFEGAAVAIDDRDRVLVAGAPAGSGLLHSSPPARLARYRKDGKRDHGFGNNGRVRVRTDTSAQGGPYAVGTDPGGRIATLSQGSSPSKRRGLDFAIARYRSG